MPPKKPPAAAKAEVAKKQKQVEDKTFGLKNKNKSSKVQKHVQNLQQSTAASIKKQNPADDQKTIAKKRKEEEAARDRELNDLFRVAISQPKVPAGVDPKSIVCEFFRRGQCTKGFKCKFSHDLSVERKGEKIDMYSDQRDEEEDTMEDWDQEKLESVVQTKSKEFQNQNKQTDIVCKHFLEAVEKKQYGWFWSCPNGGKDCMYRHALPPGYILKSQMKALLEEESNKLSIEEEIEEQRHKTTGSTPLNAETFAEWKNKKKEKRDAELAAKQQDRAKADRMSGRELFLSDASLFVDDGDAYDAYEREEVDEENVAEQRPPQQDEVLHSPTYSSWGDMQNHKPHNEAGPSTLPSQNGGVHSLLAGISEDDVAFLAEDDDELDPEELDDLEESIAKTSLEESIDKTSLDDS
eukprot:SM000022S07147  [mRNA]  locus=s22:235633:238596:+ [translate_table: standard]